jgi:hypothetical protein
VFLTFITALLPASTFVVIAPGVALISFLTYRMTKFCSSCGATVIQRPPWRELHTCPRCGAAMNPSP